MPKQRITFEVTADQLATIEELEKKTNLTKSQLLRISSRVIKRIVEAQEKGGGCYIDKGDGKLTEVFVLY